MLSLLLQTLNVEDKVMLTIAGSLVCILLTVIVVEVVKWAVCKVKKSKKRRKR